MSGNRLRQSMYPLLRAIFRALPLSDGQRDRLRTRLLAKHEHWVPPPPSGRHEDSLAHNARLLCRGDEPAIGHVPHRQAALPSPLPATLIAFYLPQFHTFPENDAWWGKGFTEWRNVTRALPQFEGHVQPRLPADLGFYDLRNPQVMRDQARLAADHGIGAFCFYFYWFAGKTLMEQPLQQWLADDSIDLPFCLCWANENWARRWDGRDEDILIAQQHSAEDDLAFIMHIAPYLRDRRALKVGGKPMLLLYRPHLLPDVRATTQRWRTWCRDNGIGEIHLAYVQGFERPDPSEIGFDAAVEFPPNMSNPKSLSADQWLINPSFQGDVRDWRELARKTATRPLPDYTFYPGVNPGWDNEARRSGKGRIYLHASPRAYRDWLQLTIHERLAAVPREQRLVFINAWNEWAEGAVLEPDARLGHAWLAATRAALEPRPSPASRRPCIVVHAWYLEALDELLQSIESSKLEARLLVTTSPDQSDDVRQRVARYSLGREVEVLAYPNHGRDILPFLHVANRLLDEGEELALKLHTKRSVHRGNGDEWRRELVERLLSPEVGKAMVEYLHTHPSIGLIAPAGHLLSVAQFMGGNAGNLQHLQTRLGLEGDVTGKRFASGSMYWCRLAALRPLLDAHLYPSDFEQEAGQIDGTLAHSVERIIEAVVHAAGFEVIESSAVTGTTPADEHAYAYADRR